MSWKGSDIASKIMTMNDGKITVIDHFQILALKMTQTFTRRGRDFGEHAIYKVSGIANVLKVKT